MMLPRVHYRKYNAAGFHPQTRPPRSWMGVKFAPGLPVCRISWCSGRIGDRNFQHLAGFEVKFFIE